MDQCCDEFCRDHVRIVVCLEGLDVKEYTDSGSRCIKTSKTLADAICAFEMWCNELEREGFRRVVPHSLPLEPSLVADPHNIDLHRRYGQLLETEGSPLADGFYREVQAALNHRQPPLQHREQYSRQCLGPLADLDSNILDIVIDAGFVRTAEIGAKQPQELLRFALRQLLRSSCSRLMESIYLHGGDEELLEVLIGESIPQTLSRWGILSEELHDVSCLARHVPPITHMITSREAFPSVLAHRWPALTHLKVVELGAIETVDLEALRDAVPSLRRLHVGGIRSTEDIDRFASVRSISDLEELRFASVHVPLTDPIAEEQWLERVARLADGRWSNIPHIVLENVSVYRPLPSNLVHLPKSIGHRMAGWF